MILCLLCRGREDSLGRSAIYNLVAEQTKVDKRVLSFVSNFTVYAKNDLCVYIRTLPRDKFIAGLSLATSYQSITALMLYFAPLRYLLNGKVASTFGELLAPSHDTWELESRSAGIWYVETHACMLSCRLIKYDLFSCLSRLIASELLENRIWEYVEHLMMILEV